MREKQINDTRAIDLLEAESSRELEAEVLKAIDGPFTPFSSEDFRAIVERIIREVKCDRAD